MSKSPLSKKLQAESAEAGLSAHVIETIDAVDAAAWDAVANPVPASFDPFVTHRFLKALENSGSVSTRAGWAPRHILIYRGKALVGACPAYLKSHSYGEFVFDQGWADAYQRNGLAYYPKLLSAVPVTPVPGRRLLVAPGPDASRVSDALVAAGIELVEATGASSFHANFLPEAEADRLQTRGFLRRTGTQYHWHNKGYVTFDDFLETLVSRKRKAFRRERRDALANGISIEWLTGKAITERHWDAMFAFYMDTGSRKWGSPYLNRKFFSLLGEALADNILLILCMREGRPIAGALNLFGAESLYGRYWGAIEHHPFLHFETCYYQAMDFAIARGLKRVEAGAGGEHKLVRGYLPVVTHSAHYIAHEGFRQAIRNYLDREREAVTQQNEELAGYAPFRRGEAPEEADI